MSRDRELPLIPKSVLRQVRLEDLANNQIHQCSQNASSLSRFVAAASVLLCVFLIVYFAGQFMR